MIYSTVPRVQFTKAMKKTRTILIPNMLPIHFELSISVLASGGYKVEALNNEGRKVVDAGLKYVHNDTCYPALLSIGQLIDALQSGKYDVNSVALMLMQTGGGCRASNYIHLLRKALIRAGYENMPVISMNLSGLEKSDGFKLTPRIVLGIFYALLYGDMIMLLENQTKPYEKNKGDTNRLVKEWTGRLSVQLKRLRGQTPRSFARNIESMARDFDSIPRTDKKRVKVGIVGEIYAKFSPLANNHLSDFLYGQGLEVMVPGIANFMAFKLDNRIEDIKLYGSKPIKEMLFKFVLYEITRLQNRAIKALDKTRFIPPANYFDLKRRLDGLLGYGCKMGEGWMLAAETIELIENGYENVVCCQPFGCLPNHIVGRGMLRKLLKRYPNANVVPIDYDPGATRVNQENRIKLMLAVARDKT